MQAKFSKYEPNSTPRQWQAHSEPLLIQENYSSANITPQKSQPRQTPKSILRESLNSSSKIKRNIQIDESLNETRKYSKTSHQSQAREIYYDEELVQAQTDHGYRPNTTIGGPLHGRYGSYYSQSSWNEKPSVTERFEVPESHSYYRGDSPPNPVHDFQEGGFSEQDFTEFQKAYIRKLQREREQEISLNMNKSSHNDIEENNEEKIHELENNLREHRKRLKASIKRQNENFAKEEKLRNKPQPTVKAPKTESPTLEKVKKPETPPQIQKSSPSAQELKQPQNREEKNVSPRLQEAPPRELSYNLQELNRISKLLKEQNEDLKYEVLSMTASQMKINPNNTYKDPVHVLANTILEKEQELIKVINKIKHKINRKQQRQPSQERIEKLSKKTITQKPKPIDVYTEKRNATRKLYGSKKLEVDNSNFLYQGLSTTYNDFHWNADQSLCLTKKLC